MLTDSLNLKSVSDPHFAGLTSKVGRFVIMLLSLIVLLPSVAQADGLFDFQMKLAQKGNAEAQFKVGEMYETGFGVKKDMAEAKSWIIKADRQGHETAGFKLLYWDLEKNGVTAENKADVEALKAKAAEGNGQAQYYVGKMHAHGVGVKKNSDEAIEWLNKAAFVGVLEAEPELVAVKEAKQHQTEAWKRSQEKKRAEAKAKQERDKKAKLEAQRKAQKQKQQQAKKARAKKEAKQEKAASEARAKANKVAADKARATAEAKALAQRKADAKRHEAEKQALMKKRAADEKKRKTEFESDPCSGKSARFLSTCK